MYTYPTIGTTLFRSFSCCCSGRDSCMLTSRCMLPWLRSAPYPALCPCEPLRLVGDMQAVSYAARSRQYSPLLPASSSQPRYIVERPRSGPMCRVHIQLSKHLKNGPGMPKQTVSVASLPRLARSTLNDLQQKQHENVSLVCVRVQSPSGLALVPCALSMVDQSGQLRC